MREGSQGPQINISKIPVGGGFAGAIVVIATMEIFLLGIPALRYGFPVAVALGCVVAWVLRRRRPKSVGAPWIDPPERK